jgi:hypothetical protein
MRTAAVAAAALLVTFVVPPRASAWGFEAHKYITRRAIDLLPPELKEFCDKHRDEIVMRSTDPDLWRTVGWAEDPNHFVDFGVKEYGVFPFSALPRELGAAIEKFGAETIRKNGMLPWRAAELAGDLRRTFDAFRRGAMYGPTNAVVFTGALVHYVQDAHQPFHASINYDGQLTGNDGIHARFERDLFEKFGSRLSIAAPVPRPAANTRDAVFDALLASYQLVDRILDADTRAAAGKDVYDDDYFEKFFASVRPILEQRLSDAIAASAGAIIAAWEQAGRPPLTLAAARAPEKVKKPQP